MSVTYAPLGAARTVTGSRHLVEADGVRILIDCGLVQERELSARNWDPLPVPAASLAAVILTHAHIDHCGWLPRLVHQGFRGPVFATRATADIVPVMLYDAARLQGEDVDTKRDRHGKENRTPPRPVEPLYDEAMVDAALRFLKPVDFEQRITVAPGITATWLPAGHILGAAMILVECGTPVRRLLFSGDLGRWNRPLVPDPVDPPAADLIVVESTYGDRLHDDHIDIEGQLESTLGATLNGGGTVIIPCFAVERAQELLWHLDRLHHAGRVPEVPVFLDSPMAVKLLKIFTAHPEAVDDELRPRLGTARSPFAFHGLQLTALREQSMAINEVRGPKIVIAGSGMLNGGRIKHHLRQIIHREDSLVLFTGYQAAGTLGRMLVQGAKQVRLFGRDYQVRCRTASVQGFSGHADRDEILGWLGRAAAKPGRIAVVHGGETIAPAFAALVAERIGVPAHAPTYMERITVE